MTSAPVPASVAALRSDHQAGQSLVLGMVLMGAAIVALIHFFQLGQVVAARSKQTHALDAAAYSGALVQARALNLLALINRTQVGHQVAMAHLVTLASWASFGATEALQFARGNPPAYLIGMLFGPEHGAAYASAALAAGMDALARDDGALAQAFLAHDALVQGSLRVAGRQVADSVVDARRAMMEAVLEASYAGAPAFFTPGDGGAPALHIEEDGWPSYLQTHAGLSLRPFVLQAAAHYGFLKPRNHTQRNPWVVDARCPSRRHELRRRGATELDAQGLWQSIDTQSHHALRSNRWIGCYFREYAMGWGWVPTQAQARLAEPHVAQPPENFAQQDFWRWVQEHTDWNIASGSGNPMANSHAVAAGVRWQGGGLPPYLDTRQGGPDAVGFVAILKRTGPQSLRIRTRSAAQAFFDRPEPRPDGRIETANLFRHYWQARLSADLLPAED
ncbi:MAG: hypothetical protein WCY98_01685 [Castellaniella sp.]